MANKKIDELQIRSDFDDTCNLPAQDASQTWRVTGAQIKTWINAFLVPFTALGDLLYGGASGAPTKLAGNTTTTKKVLVQTGNGTVSAAPTWDGTAVFNPMTAANDIIMGGASGVPTRMPGVRVFARTVATGTTTTSAPVKFDGIVEDPLSTITTGVNWKFTVPTGAGGLYRVTGRLSPNGSPGAQGLMLYKNGSAYQRIGDNIAAAAVPHFSCMLRLAAADYIDLRATSSYAYDGNAGLTSGESSIMIELISL